MPVLKVHSLPTPKGTGYHKLRTSSPSQSFHSRNFLKNFLKMCLSTRRILLLLQHLTKYLIFLSKCHVIGAFPEAVKSCTESFQGWTALEDECPCLCSHKHDLIFKSSPEKDNGEKEA